MPATSAARKDPTAEYAELLRSIPQLAPLGEVGLAYWDVELRDHCARSTIVGFPLVTNIFP